ncbi:MAG: hypothetical protein ACLFWI_26115, partial [Coleofasciculus sp.]|uniref:hypothetical protein n=1 Tax=Coleofasciculus sp. TaxID=3100458 RepID=UPI003A29B713
LQKWTQLTYKIYRVALDHVSEKPRKIDMNHCLRSTYQFSGQPSIINNQHYFNGDVTVKVVRSGRV